MTFYPTIFGFHLKTSTLNLWLFSVSSNSPLLTSSSISSSPAGLYRSVQAHHSQSRREVPSLQQQQDPGALYDFNLDEELEMDLDEETMEAMFGQDLASDTDILGMWIPEVLDWPTWVCVPFALASGLLSFCSLPTMHHFSGS